MADKNSDFIDDLDLEPLDFSGMDDSYPSDQGPILRFGAGLRDTVLSKSTAVGFIMRVMQGALPDGYVKSINAGRQLFGSLRSIKNDVHESSAADLIELADNLESRLDNIRERLPKKMVDAAERRIRSLRDESQRLVDRRREESSYDTDTRDGLNALMQETFLSQEAQAQAEKEENDEARHQRDRKDRHVIARAELEQGEALLTGVRDINFQLSRANEFDQGVKLRYMRKDLEIKYRTFQAIRDQRKLAELSYKAQMEGFKAIVYNTSLPDQMKYARHEQNRRTKLGIIGGGLNEYMTRFFGNLKDNIRDSLTTSLSTILPSMNMAMMGTEGGIGGARGAGGIMGMGVNAALQGIIAPQLGRRFRGLGRKLSARMGGQDQLAEYFLDNVPSMMQGYADNFNRPTGLRSLLHSFVSQNTPTYYQSSLLNNTGYQNIDQAATFNQLTQRSIVEVIPGYLMRILNAITKWKNGDDAPTETYDVVSGRFTSRDNVQRELRNRIVTPFERDNVQWALDGTMGRLDENTTLSSDAQKALRSQLTRDAAENRHYDPVRMSDTMTYERATPEVAQELADHFRARFEFDENNRLVRNTENNTRLNQDSKLFTQLRTTIPESQNEVRRLVNSGYQAELYEMGLVNSKNGRDTINLDRLHELLQQREEKDPSDDNRPLGGNRGNNPFNGGPSSSGPTGTESDPTLDARGNLQGALFAGRRSVPVITPEGLGSEAYFDQATKRPIKTVRDIRGPIVDRNGNIVISVKELDKGLHDRYGKVIVQVDDPIKSMTRGFFKPKQSTNTVTDAPASNTGDAPVTPVAEPAEQSDPVQRVRDRFNKVRFTSFVPMNDQVTDRVNKERDRATDFVQRMSEATRRRYDEALDKVDQHAPDVKAKVKEALSKTSTQYQSAKESFAPFKERTTQRVKDDATKYSQSVKDQFDKLDLDSSKRHVRDRLDRIQSKLDDILERGNATTTHLKEDTSPLKERATAYKDRVKDAVRENASTLKDKVTSRGDALKERLSKMDLRSKGRAKVDALKERAHQLTEGRITPKELAEQVTGSIKDARRRLRDYLRDPERFEKDKEALQEKVSTRAQSFNERLRKKTAEVKEDLPHLSKDFIQRLRQVRSEYGDKFRGGYDRLAAQDVYVKGRKDPVIRASDMLEGKYFDAGTGNPIKSLHEIHGDVIDKEGNIVVSEAEVESGLYSKFGKKIFDHQRSLKARFGGPETLFGSVKETVANTKRRAKGVMNFGRRLGFGRRAFDIYVEGETYPRMTALKMKEGEYIDLKTEKTVFSIDDIRGPVADVNGNMVLDRDDLKHLCDVSGKRVKIAGLLMRGIKALGRGWWKFTKAYYSGLAKVAPKLAGKALGLGTRTLGRVLGSSRLANVGRGAAKAAGAYTGATRSYYGGLGRLASKGLGGLGRGVGRVLGIRRKPYVSKLNPEYRSSLGDTEKTPEVSLLAGINDKLSKMIPKEERVGSWRDIFNKRREAIEKRDKDKADAQKGEGSKTLLGGLVGGLKSLRDLFKKKEEDDDKDSGDIDIDLGDRRDRKGRSRRSRRRDRMGRKSRLGRVGNAARGLGRGLARGGRLLGRGVLGAGMAGYGMYQGYQRGGILGAGKEMVGSTVDMLTGGGASTLARGAGAIGRGAMTAGRFAIPGMIAGASALGSGITGLLGSGAMAAGAAALGPLAVGALAIGGVALAGYGLYKGWQWYKQKYAPYLTNIRLAQYGVLGNDDLADKVMKLEGALAKESSTDRIDFTKVQLTSVTDIFGLKNADQEKVNNAMAWFKYRFTPIYMKHRQALNGLNPQLTLLDVDEKLSNKEKITFINNVTFPYSGETPYNYAFSPNGGQLSVKSSDIKAEFDKAKQNITVDSSADKGKPIEKAKDAKGNLITEEKTTKTATIADFGKRLQDEQNRLKAESDKVKASDSQSVATVLSQYSKDKNVKGVRTDQLSAVQQIRFNAYGLPDKAKGNIDEILAFEKLLKDRLSYSKDGVGINVKADDLMDDASKIFGFSKEDEVGSTRFRQWFEGRFMPTYLTWANAVDQSRSHADLTGSDADFDYSQQLNVAKRLIAVQGKLFGREVPINQVPYTPFNGKNEDADAENDTLVKALEKQVANKVIPGDPNLNRPTTTGVMGKGDLMRSGVYQKKQEERQTQDKVAASNNFTLQAGRIANQIGGKTPSGDAIGEGLSSKGQQVPYTKGEVAAMQDGAGGVWKDLPTPAKDGDRKSAEPLLQKVGLMTGVDPNVLATMAGIESGYKSAAKAGTSSAGGLFQFVDGTWQQVIKQHGSKYGIEPAGPNDRRKFDPRINALMGAEFTKDNAKGLREVLGREPKDTELYLAHFMGLGGARNLLTKDRGANAVQLFPKEARANASIFTDKGQPRTIQGVIDELDRRVSAHRKGGIERLSNEDKERSATDPTVDQKVGGDDNLPTSSSSSDAVSSNTAPKADAPSASKPNDVSLNKSMGKNQLPSLTGETVASPTALVESDNSEQAPDDYAQSKEAEGKRSIAELRKNAISRAQQQEHGERQTRTDQDSLSYLREGVEVSKGMASTLSGIFDILNADQKYRAEQDAADVPKSGPKNPTPPPARERQLSQERQADPSRDGLVSNGVRRY